MNFNRGKMVSILTVAIVAAAVTGTIFWWQRTHSTECCTDPASATSTPGGASSTPSSTPTSTPAKKPASGSPGMTYSEAVRIFAARRMQFDQSCNATPESFTVKSGTTIMFDNRSSETRTIALDGTPYTLAAYGWKVLTLRSSRLPHTVSVDCGGGRNNARIILQ